MPFVSSQFEVQFRPRVEAPCCDHRPGEGRGSEQSRAATEALLLPQGRPGGWLLLLAALWSLVFVQAVVSAAH